MSGEAARISPAEEFGEMMSASVPSMTVIASDVVVPPLDRDASLIDARFRALVGEDGWARLPAAVQGRFSKFIAPGEAVLYRGEVTETYLSRRGRLLAHIARIIGGPLPLMSGVTGAAVVAVTAMPGGAGQVWTRMYERTGRFPQVVHSMKRFAGPTGLEEYVGFGIGMALTVREEAGALIFRSAFYFLAAGSRRWRLPRWLSPGAMTITHQDLGGSFRFDLQLTGADGRVLILQRARFTDVAQ